MIQPRPKGQIAVSVGVLVLGMLVLAGGWDLSTGGGYAQVGPGVMPRIVGTVLLLLGAMLLREALTGGFHGVDEEAEVRIPMDWKAFAWITAGIFLYGFLVERAGFIIASTLLFAAVARSFASRRWLSNLLVGLALGAFIFAVFNYGLGLNLPAGVLGPVLP
ncbi:MAG TPA: tripartite tricarboxylate transporter TctB family protein [Usitatibacteraceae bacterium]|nr:tripartite tricarboxylate transporter TctB family protein [Usitatibacteraceae bacterium]